ncbi:MAG: hypothetical protein IJJ33_13685 [Victivallales bacterium]|nr:hypothetical protein [Victivallales bacterium]MBQ6473031.1 hypothetical protein [Victivallales bacterium]
MVPFFILVGVEGDRGKYGFYFDPSNENPTAVVWPLFLGQEDIFGSGTSSSLITINFQVNRKLFENAQGLKIKVSIQNQKEEENLTP